MTVAALPTRSAVGELRAAADAAAARARVDVREIGTPDECDAACSLVREVWSSAPAQSPLEPSLLRALAYSGGYAVGAFDGDAMVGVCVGFFGHDLAHGMHSHLAAVAPRAQGRGLGSALKLHQRAWAGERGVPTISWTFDPLVGRNATFNLHRLDASVVDYLPDFYGDMRDGLNAGHGSDRMLIRWSVLADAPTPRPTATPVPVLSAGPDGRPLSLNDGSPAPLVTVAVPADVTALRLRDAAAAKAWRAAVRAAVVPRMGEGWRVRGFDSTAGYLLEHP